MASILHVSQPTSGGVGRAVLGLAKAQLAAGLDVTVACPAGALQERLLAAGIRWDRWESEREPGRRVAEERRSLKRILHRREPHLVHLHSSKAGLVGRLTVRRSIPTIFQPHAWSFLAATGKTRLAAVLWERYATRWTDLTFFCSRREQQEGFTRGISGLGRVVLNGVDLSHFKVPAPADRSNARKQLSLPADAFIAAVVGRQSEQKGQDIAIRAWKMLPATACPKVLVLVGEGYEDGSDPDNDSMTYAARVDVKKFFLAADLMLSPSRWEGLSLSLLEGMACARPTIATDVAGSREAMIDGPLPAAGAVIATEDADALAAEIRIRLLDPGLVRIEGKAARRRVESSFDEAATTASILDTYRLVSGDFRSRAVQRSDPPSKG